MRPVADQEQHRESKHDSRKCLKHKVVGRRRLELRVDFAEQYHAVARRAGKHPEHAEKPFVLICRIKMPADPSDVKKRCDRPQGADEHERQGEVLELREVDRGGACDDHDVERETADPVQQVVVDVFPPEDFGLLAAVEEPLNQNPKQRTEQEVEPPHQRLQRVCPESPEIKALDRRVEKIYEEICKDNEANLYRQLVN